MSHDQLPIEPLLRRDALHFLGNRMPQVIVYAASGRTAAQKKALMRAITQAFVDNFDVKSPQVIVQIVEASPDSKAKGGIPYDELG